MHSKGKAIGLGVHMYVYIMCVCEKKIKWHISIGLTFSNSSSLYNLCANTGLEITSSKRSNTG